MSLIVQEVLVFALVAAAALYLIHRVAGWPSRRRRASVVRVSGRLQRGLDRARK